jgi:hypothetical protein
MSLYDNAEFPDWIKFCYNIGATQWPQDPGTVALRGSWA